MEKKLYIFLGLMVVIGFVMGAIVFYDKPNEDKGLGSTPIAGEYHSTTTRRANGTAIANLAVLKSGSGTLGSVIITGANDGTINIYDATSTATNTEWGTTTLASFSTSTPRGTYTFDSIARKGILIEVLGSVPTSTVTFR